MANPTPQKPKLVAAPARCSYDYTEPQGGRETCARAFVCTICRNCERHCPTHSSVRPHLLKASRVNPSGA